MPKLGDNRAFDTESKFLYVRAMAEKPLIWLGTPETRSGGFPDAARQIAGFQLWRVQRGLEPNDWKPMPSVGPGVQEIRIHTGAEHRVFYIAKFAEAVYVLHAFEKRGRRTSKDDLDLARHRLRLLLHQRARGKG
jgi:phage-related protein